MVSTKGDKEKLTQTKRGELDGYHRGGSPECPEDEAYMKGFKTGNELFNFFSMVHSLGIEISKEMGIKKPQLK